MRRLLLAVLLTALPAVGAAADPEPGPGPVTASTGRIMPVMFDLVCAGATTSCTLLNQTLAGTTTILGSARFSDGTSAAPSISFTSDTGTGFRRSSLGVVTFDSQGADSVQLGQNTLTGFSVLGGNGSSAQLLSITELITLNTGAATTDSAANLLPANSIILGVVWRVTTTITTAVNYSIGDPTTAARFVSANTGVAATSTGVGFLQLDGAVATSAAGPTQTAAAKLRITCNATPGAGVVRVVVFYRLFNPPTS